MTHDEIVEMAEQAGMTQDGDMWFSNGKGDMDVEHKHLVAFAKLVAAKDYERGFIDGMQKQMQSSVDKAVNAMSQRTWVGLTNNDLQPIAEEYRILFGSWVHDFARAIEAKLKEKNNA